MFTVEQGERLPKCVFTHQLTESVTSVAAGFVATPVHQELVAASYSGRVMSFTTEPLTAGSTKGPDFTAHKTSQQRQKKLMAMKAEVLKLQERLEREKVRAAQRPAAELPSVASVAPVALNHSLSQVIDAPFRCVCVCVCVFVEKRLTVALAE